MMHAENQPRTSRPQGYRTVNRRTFVKGAAILAGTGVLAAHGRAATASTPAAVLRRAAAQLSTLSWGSGCWNGNDAPSEATAFGDWRANPVDVAVAWPDLGSWTSYTTQPNDIYAAFSGAPFPIAWGISPIPFDGGVSTMAQCAAGAYNDHWTNFANTMVAYGLDNSIIRLGWELNGDWYPWGGDPNFVAAWQQIVDTVRPIAPGLQWNWNVNLGSNNGFPGDAVLGAYPGDTYVDMIGLDSYDKGGATLDQMLNGEYGLQYWLDFAVAHNKKLSVPEWGLWTSSNQGHDDDPAYITMMHNFFADNASNIAFEAYFNDAESGIASSLYNPDLYPHSSAVYQNLWTGAATRIIDDYHPAVTFSGAWTPTYLPQYLGDRIDFSETYSNTAGSYAELAFTGTGVTWVGNTYTNRGTADIYLDGIYQTTVDCYSASWASQVALYTATGLSGHTHVIKVVVTGQKNPSATDCILAIDAFTGPDIVTPGTLVDDSDTSAITFSGAGWTPTYNPTWLGDRIDFTETYSNETNDYAELTFNGTSVTWIGNMYVNRGMADIYIDGALQTTVDCYAATWTTQAALYTSPWLVSGTHTIKVVVNGEKNPNATDTILAVDAFTYTT